MLQVTFLASTVFQNIKRFICVAKGLIPSPLGRFIAFKDTPLLAAG